VLDPDVVLRADYGELRLGVPKLVRGAQDVATQAQLFSQLGPAARLALVNGAIGCVVFMDERLFAVVGFTVANEKIVELNILADPQRLDQLAIAQDL
jgi:RNA polymerase sigma-70 factor (ECF subfamily)